MKINNNTQIVLNDLHIPFHNTIAVKMVINFIREQRPGTIHLLGDCCDLYSVSKFDKDPARRFSLQDELDAVRDWLRELRDCAPRARIIYSEGNHEYRLRKYLISEAKALAGLRSLTLEKLLDFDTLKIRFQPQDRPYRIGHLLFTHGQFVSRWSAMTLMSISHVSESKKRIGKSTTGFPDLNRSRWSGKIHCSRNPFYSSLTI